MHQEIEVALNNQTKGGRLTERELGRIIELLAEEESLELYDWELLKRAVVRRISRLNEAEDTWNQHFWSIMGFGFRFLMMLPEGTDQRSCCRRIDWINAIHSALSMGSIGEMLSRREPRLRKNARRMLTLLRQEAEQVGATTVVLRLENTLEEYHRHCRVEIRQRHGQTLAHVWQQAG